MWKCKMLSGILQPINSILHKFMIYCNAIVLVGYPENAEPNCEDYNNGTYHLILL